MKLDIYKGDSTIRFVIGKSGLNPLIIFGINPSNADQCNSDRTISRIEKLLGAWPFDGFMLFNLYPLRNSKPELLPPELSGDLAKQNVAVIREALKNVKARVVWAAWGDAFDKRDYFKDRLDEILRVTKDLNLEWNRCESLTNSQNPRHLLGGRPHRITEQSQLTKFNVEEYLRQKK